VASRRMICSLPEVKAIIGPERPICARLKLTSKNPLKAKLELLGEGQSVVVHPVNEFAIRIPLVVPSCKMNGGVFAGVVPVHARLDPVEVNGSGPVIAKSLAGVDAVVEL